MCAYPTDQTNQTARWSHIQDIIDVLQGTTADRIQIIQYNNSSYYAGDFRNLDTTNSYGLRVRDASNNNLLLVYKNNLALGASAATDALAINCNISGKVYIGDSSNANMTAGLTINQAANDDELLAAKSSDVAHGMTDIAETDTFLALAKIDAALGGGQLTGFGEGASGIMLRGYGGSANTTKTTTSTGAVRLVGAVKSGTTVGDAGADGNLVTIANNATTRFIFDVEGSAHADVEWTTYDDHDDLALLNHLDAAMTRDPIKTEFGRYLSDYRQQLQDAKIANFYDPNGSRAMVNMTRLAMLHTGAIRQVGSKIDALAERLALAESRLAALPEGGATA